MTNIDITDDESPMPPRSGPRARYDGTQLLSPHQPNSVQAFISVTKKVTRAIFGVKSSPMRPRSAFAVSSQIFGSSTLRRIHIVNSAGMTPTKKTPRQPQIGITSRVTRAAEP